MIQKLKKEDGTSIVSRDEKLQDKIDNNIKYDIWEPHSSYTAGTKPTSKIKYRAWQLPLIGIDKNGKVIKAKEKIPPLLFKKTMVRALKRNFIGSEDIYYRGWAEDYPKDPSTLKKIY